MENGAIHDSRITASSSLDNKHTALQARLHLTADSRTGGGWSALKDDFYQWLQIELGGYTTVTRVATQGGNGRNEWVTHYRLKYSRAGNIFKYYKLRENSSAMVSIHKAQSCSLDLWRFVGFVVNRKCNLWQSHRRKHYAPINVNPVRGGGGGVRARGGDLTNFKIFWSNSPGWETKGQSKVSKKPPPQGKKSKQTIP